MSDAASGHNQIPDDVPFVLSCYECDRDSPDSYDEAVRDGWTEIKHYPEGSSESFLGFCQDCRPKHEASIRRE